MENNEFLAFLEENEEISSGNFVEDAFNLINPDEYSGTGTTLKLVPLHHICVRYENYYGSDTVSMTALIKEIEEDGQLTPIKIYRLANMFKHSFKQITKKEDALQNRNLSYIRIAEKDAINSFTDKLNSIVISLENSSISNNDVMMIDSLLQDDETISQKENCITEIDKLNFTVVNKEDLKDVICFISGLKQISFELKEKNVVDELIYYTRMFLKGCKLFVNEGHRRFKAFVSLALKITVIYDDEIEELYPELKKIYKNNPENKWIFISSEIGNDLEIAERAVNDNLFQRAEINQFTTYYNYLKLMKFNGSYKKCEEEAIKSTVNAMKVRAVRDHLKKLINEGVVKRDEFEQCENNENELRSLLKKQKLENIPKANIAFGTQLSDVIYERTGRRVQPTSIGYIENIINNFDKKIIKEIINGNITLSEAREMLPVYDELIQKYEINGIVNTVRNSKKRGNKLKEILSSTKQEDNKKKKKNYKYSSDEVLEMLEQIRLNAISVEDMIKKVKKANEM